jgi:carbon monoxide dehydrogenase subunit G
MQFDNAFDVPLPPASAWRVLMDIARIAPCVPGAELTEQLDDRSYKGKIGVRLGPVALTFAGTARFEEIDDAAQTARVKASGTDAKGRGGANAVASFRLEPTDTGTRVLIHTDLTLSGAVGQYGRGAGMIEAVATQIIQQFAQALHAQIAAEQASMPVPEPVAAKPISGFALIFSAFRAWLRRALSLVPRQGT